MNSIASILFLGARVVLASLIALTLQILMLVKLPDHLLRVQQEMKSLAAGFFDVANVESRYHVAYNLIGGDNIIVHTFFVLIAYVSILILLLPFKSRRPSYRKYRSRSG
jgi:hypothetical protein